MARRLPQNIEPGELRHRIQIAAPAGTQDASGGVTQDPSLYTVVRTCWAQIETWSGTETMAANTFTEKTSHWITIRHPRTFLPLANMLVWFNGRTFIIQDVLNPTEQNRLLVLVCAEVNQSQSSVPTTPAT
jgi:SPP1 family predicted phage head-tail adaptor